MYFLVVAGKLAALKIHGSPETWFIDIAKKYNKKLCKLLCNFVRS